MKKLLSSKISDAVSLVAAAGGLLNLFVPRAANACEPPFCYPSVAAPPGGSIIPANAPVLVFWSGTTPPSSEGIELVGPNGLAINLSVEPEKPGSPVLLLRPSPALASGASYLLRYQEQCTESEAVRTGVIEQTFTAGPPAAIPATSGSLAMTSRIAELSVWTSAGSCTTSRRAAIVQLNVSPSPDLQRYLPLVRVETWADGKLWQSTPHGAMRTDGSIKQPLGHPVYTSRQVERLHATCERGSRGDDEGLTLGRHRVELRFHVAGITSGPPPLVTEIDFSCSEQTGDGGPVLDAATQADLPDGTTASAGCTCSIRGAGAGPAGLPAVLLLMAVCTRRRASQRRQKRLASAKNTAFRVPDTRKVVLSVIALLFGAGGARIAVLKKTMQNGGDRLVVYQR